MTDRMGDLASQDSYDPEAGFRLQATNRVIQPGVSLDYPPSYQPENPLNPPLVDQPPQAAPQWMMGQLAAQDQYRPLGNDPWTGLMRGQIDLPLEGAPEPPSPVVFKTASPLANITQADIDRGVDLALSFSGGGLSTKPMGGILAYHGSPHDFERFDLSKISTGEGAQAYGHGLYFAGAEPTAQFYREQLGGKEFTLNNKVIGKYGEIGKNPVGNAVARVLQQMGNEGTTTAENIAAAKAKLLEVHKNNPGIYQPREIPQIFSAMDDLEGQQLGYKFPGRMYEVNINADPAQMLDWDKPLRDQPHVQDVLADQMLGKLPNMGIRNLRMVNEDVDMLGGKSADILYRKFSTNPREASAILNEAGIPGIKYLDAGSRGAGQGSSNYVVFNPAIIDILRKYGLVGAAPVGIGALAAQDQYNTP